MERLTEDNGAQELEGEDPPAQKTKGSPSSFKAHLHRVTVWTS